MNKIRLLILTIIKTLSYLDNMEISWINLLKKIRTIFIMNFFNINTITCIASTFLLYLTFKQQKKFNKDQRIISENEQFKSTFFSLLEEHRNILKNLSGTCKWLNSDITTKKKSTVYGREYIKMMLYYLDYIYKILDSPIYYSNYDSDMAEEALDSIQDNIYTGLNVPPELEKENEDLIKNAKRPFLYAYIADLFSISKNEYEKYKELPNEKKVAFGYAIFYRKGCDLNNYFRHLYRILKWISNTKMDMQKNSNKHNKISYDDYAQFIQSQMSDEELLMIYYNSFLFHKLKDLIIEFNLLENLNKDLLLQPWHVCGLDLNLKDNKTLYKEILN